MMEDAIRRVLAEHARLGVDAADPASRSRMAGYGTRSPDRWGRLLRDADGAALMVNNDRVLGNNNAQLLLASKEI